MTTANSSRITVSSGPDSRHGQRGKILRIFAALVLTAAFLVPIDAAVVGVRADAATCASANLTVTPLASSIFYADFSPSPPTLPNLAGHYTGYRITNTSGSAVNGAWVKLSNFTGGVVNLASGQAGAQPLVNLSPSGSGLSYFYLAASGTTSAAQTHTVSVYDRRPDLVGAVELCNTSFTYTSVTGTTQAAANKVTIATATSNPPGLGAVMTLTVTGDTGTIGNGPSSDPKGFDMTPAAVASGASAWTPSAFRLFSVQLNLDLTGGGATTSSDFLHYTLTDSSGSARTYTATYKFLVVGTTSANTPVTPVQYIASGTQIKHTDLTGSGYAAIQPIQPISNATTIAKSASPAALTTPGGTVTYTVTATNTSGTQTATLDDFTDTPGTGATYVAGTSKFNGVTIGDPITSGSSLVWADAFAVPPGTSRSLTYDMSIVSGIGTVSNSAVGHIGVSTIDTTTTTADSSPATKSVTVAAAPTLALTKTVGSRRSAPDQFTVAITNGATTVASASTSGAGTTAATGAQTLASGTTYTLTDAMTSGSPSTISQYVGTVSCTNATTGSTTVLPAGSGAPFSITPLAGDVISCSITNAPVPVLTLVKSVPGRVVSNDQFTVAIINGATTVASATTSGTGTSATTGSTDLAAATTYTLTDTMASGSTSTLSTYASAVACTNSASGTFTTLPSGTGTVLTGSTSATTLTAGTVYTLTDDITAGSSTSGDYASSIACTNSTAGTGTTLPSGIGNSFTITPRVGDVIACTFLNQAVPRVTLVNTVAGRADVTDQFRTEIIHGATTDATATTTGSGTTATTGATNLSNGTAYSLTDAMASGSASAIGAYTTSISCTNARSGSTTVLPTGSGTSFTLTPAFDDQITCTITNAVRPHLTLTKTVASRAAAGDQFTVAIEDGATTVDTASTTGVATAATTGTNVLSAGTAYTLTDVMAGGSASVIGQYASSISCTNATTGSATVLPSGIGAAFSLTPADGDLITCTFTNTAGTATFGFTKTTPIANVVLGDVVTYTFDVTNSGSLPLVNVSVTDTMPGLSMITCSPAQGTTLAASATMSCTATYTVNQADVDAGSIMNTATVIGSDPSGNTVTTTAGSTVNVAQSSSFSLTKSATPSSGVVAGSVVVYTLQGTNTGTTTLHNVTVTDPLVTALTCTPSPAATLAPAQSISCTGSYTVTQADVDTGSVLNTGTISGSDPSNNPVSSTGSTTVTASQNAALSLTKTVTPTNNASAGTTLTYTLTGQNTGDTTLHGVGITDPLNGLFAFSCTPNAPATLAPNAAITCTASYTVTQADVASGSISNTATINGDDPANIAVTNTASRTVLVGQTNTLVLAKTATPNSGVVAGDTVTYGFDVTNTGTVATHAVGIADAMAGIGALICSPVAPATLAPNATMHCGAGYTVTQADVDGGPFTNTATVTGLDTANNPVSDSATATVTPNSTTGVNLTKTATPGHNVTLGTLLTYSMTATNTGTTTLQGTTITDPMIGLSVPSCSPAAGADLAPGASMTCTAMYTVTATDVRAGQILNDASVTGHNLNGLTVTHASAATVPTSGATGGGGTGTGTSKSSVPASATGRNADALGVADRRFARTGSEALELGLLGLFGLIGGWLLMAVAHTRRRSAGGLTAK